MRKIIIALLFFPIFSVAQKPKGEPTLQSSCTVCSLTDVIHFTGENYWPGRNITIEIYKEGMKGYYSMWDYLIVPENGVIEFDILFKWGPGNYKVWIYQQRTKGRYELQAETFLTLL